MKKYIIVAILTVISNVAFGQCPCSIYATEDYCDITLVHEDPENYNAVFFFEWFVTCADGLEGDDEITWMISDGCHDIFHTAGADVFKDGCAWLCWPCWCQEPCLGYASHGYARFYTTITYYGKFDLKAIYKEQTIGDWHFEFGEHPFHRIPRFIATAIQSKFGEEVPSNAVFDIDEEIGMSVFAEWDTNPENPDRTIDAIIKATNCDDSLIVGLPLISAMPVALYSTVLGPGCLRALFNDPESHFYWYTTETLTIYPRKSGCYSEDYIGPEDQVEIGMYELRVDTISFADSKALCREDNSTVPAEGTIPIDSIFQWDRFGKNEPACYIKNNPLTMDIKIKANHVPRHLLPFKVWGLTQTHQRFIVPEFEFELEYTNYFDTSGLETMGNLPDSIGYDVIEYFWQFYVSAMRPRDTGTQSGPHLIYRIFDEPITSHPDVYPINVDACLNKVCKEYAFNENEILTILDLTSYGIHDDFTYNAMLPIYPNPMDLFRRTRGQCAGYSKYMTAIMNGIGIPVNCRTVLSGKERSTDVLFERWVNTYYEQNYPNYDAVPCDLWTLPNMGGREFPDEAFNFYYHMITNYFKYNINGPDTTMVNYVYDPVYCIDEVWEDWIGEEFRYYYNVPCCDDEPPITLPGFWDWPVEKLPSEDKATPNWLNQEVKYRDCKHPR